MLIQLHHQYPNGSTEFVAQNEIPDDATQDEGNAIFREWAPGVKKRHPLPDGCMWCLCTQDAPQFVWAAVSP